MFNYTVIHIHSLNAFLTYVVKCADYMFFFSSVFVIITANLIAVEDMSQCDGNVRTSEHPVCSLAEQPPVIMSDGKENNEVTISRAAVNCVFTVYCV